MNSDIKTMADRFMAGLTTPAEEQHLAEYFRTHVCTTDEERTLKAMFGWFDSGMPLSDDNSPILNKVDETPVKNSRRARSGQPAEGY